MNFRPKSIRIEWKMWELRQLKGALLMKANAWQERPVRVRPIPTSGRADVPRLRKLSKVVRRDRPIIGGAHRDPLVGTHRRDRILKPPSLSTCLHNLKAWISTTMASSRLEILNDGGETIRFLHVPCSSQVCDTTQDGHMSSERCLSNSAHIPLRTARLPSRKV